MRKSVASIKSQVSNWGRWGHDDELGCLNHIGPTQRKRAASLVRDGVSVSLAFELDPDGPYGGQKHRPGRYMTHTGEYSGEAAAAKSVAADVLQLPVHGVIDTHIDSLGHYFDGGKMYGGHPSSLVTASEGARRNSVAVAANGIISRGILIDVPVLQSIDWLEGGEGVGHEQLLGLERALGLTFEPGDVLLLRTGQYRRRSERGAEEEGYTSASWLVDALPLLHERDVAAIGSDGPNETLPSGYESEPHPVHQVAIVHMGLWLLDNLNLEELSQACRARGRYDFCFFAAPLRVIGATGSPLSPIATF